jgi:hypothetical protein
MTEAKLNFLNITEVFAIEARFVVFLAYQSELDRILYSEGDHGPHLA